MGDNLNALFTRVAAILDQARTAVDRTINVAMVQAYWHIGREIVEVEQAGSDRAGYGDEVIRRLLGHLGRLFGKGFSISGLQRMRRFYRLFPRGSAIGSTLSTESAAIASTALTESGADQPRFSAAIGWSHYLVLMRVANDQARAFYEIEAVREAWSVRELERQVAAQLFERLAKNKKPEEVLALARSGQHVAKPGDVIKDPFVLEFLDLREPAHLRERDIEQAIIDRIEAFLLEMGKGFTFVGRQEAAHCGG